MKNFQKNLDPDDKKIKEEQLIRRRIDAILPAEFHRSEQLKKRSPMVNHADKHTYSSMKKISCLKSRKMYNFENYTAKY